MPVKTAGPGTIERLRRSNDTRTIADIELHFNKEKSFVGNVLANANAGGGAWMENL
jgi:hypothetical protein